MTWRQSVEPDSDKRDLELVQGSLGIPLELVQDNHYFNHHIPLVLQCGPTCGIALLTSLILNKDPTVDVVTTANQLLEGAISLGLSKSGEIMCPQFMSRMCDLAGIQHHVAHVSRDSDVTELLKDSVLMIIYDKDKNNEPTTKYGGERAHWLLVTGFCFKDKIHSTNLSKVPEGKINVDVTTANPQNSPITDNARLNDMHVPDNARLNGLHVFVQHGKSRLRQLWRWKDILDSNESVKQAKPGDWVVPDNFHASVAGTVVRVPVKTNS